MATRRPIFAAFDQGQIPQIAVFNQATTPLGLDLDKFIAALQTFVTDYVVPVWGTPARLVRTNGFKKGAWAVVFLDTADQANALAYHDLTPDGFPLSKVFVKTIADDGASLTVATSHELVEMLVDPAINLLSLGPDPKAAYAYESADPVEADSLGFSVNGFKMSDFVYPSYFENFHKPSSTKFDYRGKVTRPFQILAGGYQLVFKNGKWSQLTATKAKARALKDEDRRQHRSEIRKKPPERRRRSRPARR
ncbi:MAG TPA: hypothetical protein VFJ70_20035 [Burkholderiales bacterium]|nr:hypothetical protein [Burkholderiales bacterium]